MLTATLIAVALIFLFALSIASGKDVKLRRTLFDRNNHFLGRNINDVIDKVGHPHSVQSGHIGKKLYIWGTGDFSTLLTTDSDGIVIDYSPMRLSRKFLDVYFQKKQLSMTGLKIEEIEREIGCPHNYYQHDFGHSVYIWKLKNQRTVEVYCIRGACVDITFKSSQKDKTTSQ